MTVLKIHVPKRIILKPISQFTSVTTSDSSKNRTPNRLDDKKFVAILSEEATRLPDSFIPSIKFEIMNAFVMTIKATNIPRNNNDMDELHQLLLIKEEEEKYEKEHNTLCAGVTNDGSKAIFPNKEAVAPRNPLLIEVCVNQSMSTLFESVCNICFFPKNYHAGVSIPYN